MPKWTRKRQTPNTVPTGYDYWFASSLLIFDIIDIEIFVSLMSKSDSISLFYFLLA